MPATWEPSFNFYLSRIDEEPVSIVLDLNAQTLPSHPVRLQIRVPLRVPRADGLRDSSELEAMGRIEDQVVDSLTPAFDAVFVGRYVMAGSTVFIFYLPESAKAETCLEVIGSMAPYEAQWLTKSDPPWSFFHNFLYPNPYAFQSMLSRSLVQQLQTAGDALVSARPIDHLALFDDRAVADQASTHLAAKGFSMEPVAPHEGGGFELAFRRDDEVTDAHPDVFVGEILDVILPIGGRYDGWGCPVVK